MTLASPDLWLKICIAIGAVTMVFLLLFPRVAESQFSAEEKRHDGCLKGQRVDCEPNIYWAIRGWGDVARTQ